MFLIAFKTWSVDFNHIVFNGWWIDDDTSVPVDANLILYLFIETLNMATFLLRR